MDKILKEAEGIVNMNRLKVGDRAKDSISGFEGLATGRTEYIGGKIQFEITPTNLTETGLPYEGIWFDEERLEKV